MTLPEPVPDLISLDVLTSVATSGSIRQAALAHNLSQPAASMRLRKLEQVLGVDLLARAPGGAQLTPAGHAVVQWSQLVLDDVRSLVAGVAALRREGHTVVEIAASMTVAEYLAPEWLVRLAALEPELQVSLEMANSEHVLERVRDGDVALGFVEGIADLTGLRSRVVADDELVPVVDSGHPWARRRGPVTAERLAATPLVMREEGSGTREVLDRWLAARGLTAEARLVLGSTTAIKRVVESGAGPAVLSRLAVASEVREGRLVEVAVRDADLSRAIRAVWSRGAPLSPAAKRVLARISSDATVAGSARGSRGRGEPARRAPRSQGVGGHTSTSAGAIQPL